MSGADNESERVGGGDATFHLVVKALELWLETNASRSAGPGRPG